MLVYNPAELGEWVQRGDVLARTYEASASTRSRLAPVRPRPPSAVHGGDEVRRLVQLEDPKEILAADVPGEAFFERLADHFRAKFPEASAEMVEHVVALERMCWHSTAFGISWKCAKIQLAQALAKLLGEYVGRGVRLKDPEKREAIRVFPAPNSLKQLQEFLGMFNYMRSCCRPTSARHIHVLKPWLRGEEFPLSAAALDSIEALKEEAMEQVAISSIDENAAIRAFHPDESERLARGDPARGEPCRLFRVRHWGRARPDDRGSDGVPPAWDVQRGAHDHPDATASDGAGTLVAAPVRPRRLILRWARAASLRMSKFSQQIPSSCGRTAKSRSSQGPQQTTHSYMYRNCWKLLFCCIIFCAALLKLCF